MTADISHPCGCKDAMHGPGGCIVPGGTYEGEPTSCEDCGPFYATGYHLSTYKRGRPVGLRLYGGYSREEWDEMASDAELRHDEFGGISESELREWWGK